MIVVEIMMMIINQSIKSHFIYLIIYVFSQSLTDNLMLQLTLHLAKLATLFLIKRLYHLQQTLLVGIQRIHIHAVAIDHLHEHLSLLLLDFFLFSGRALGDDGDVTRSENGFHSEDIVVISKLAGGCANTDMSITPPVVGEGDVIGEADMEIAAIVLVDGHTYLLGGMVVTDLHNGVVIDLEI